MKFLSSHMTHRVFILSFVGIFFMVIYLAHPSFLKTPKVESATSDNVSGFAWSDNIGWISFNNTSDGSAVSYGVQIDTVTGNFSGYAWSDNIGWISFNRAQTNNPPSAPFNTGTGAIAAVDLSTGAVTGWARALAGCEEVSGVPVTSCASSGAGAASPGWDGWIKLSDASWTNGAKIDVTTGNFSGFAWGSTVVGWVDFAPVGGGVVVKPPFVCTPPLDPYGVCGSTKVCAATGPGGSGVCITPGGSCVANIDCGGGQTCKSNGVCGYASYCAANADCSSNICNIATNTCVVLPGGGRCGDGTCSTGESLLLCPKDCKGKVQQF